MSTNTNKRIVIFLISIITFLIISKFLFGSLIRSDTSVGEKKYIVFSLKAPNKNFDIIKKDSINEENKKYNFIITDFNKEISVTYSGILPNLFVEGQGAVVEGNLISRKTFVGTKILAKHDENYMPKEVADSLKKIGNFKRK